VIHGRSPDRDTLKSHLERLGVGKVVVLVDEFEPTTPIPDKFERYATSVDGAIALVTPDDLGSAAEELAATEARARQNVWLEVGWFWGRRGRSKVLLLTKGKVAIPSDIGNVEHYDYDDDPRERDPQIKKFIHKLRFGSDAA
jgi:predicted nucleotide-binding protein